MHYLKAGVSFNSIRDLVRVINLTDLRSDENSNLSVIMKKSCFLLFSFYIITTFFSDSLFAAGTNPCIDSIPPTVSAAPVGVSHPIRFLRFSAVRHNNQVLIEWTIPSENSSNYRLERSDNGTEWIPVASFAPVIGFNAISKYEFNDRNVKAKIVYYRVMQIYANGRYSYSPIVSAKAQVSGEKIKISSSTNKCVLIYFPQETKNDVIVRVHSLSGQGVSLQKIIKPVGQVLISLSANIGKSCIINISDGQKLNLSQLLIL